MSDKIHLKVITHEKIIYENDIDELYVQTTEGRIGILKNHLPLIAVLDYGVSKLVKNQTSQCMAIMGGIIQFSDNRATILTDGAEFSCDIDVARAKESKRRAQERLNAKEDNLDSARAQVSLAKAIARINATDNKYM